MKNDIRVHNVILMATKARRNLITSENPLSREVFRYWYMSLGSIVHNEAETMELRREALDAMHRLQLRLY